MGTEGQEKDVARILFARAFDLMLEKRVRDILQEIKPLLHDLDIDTNRAGWSMIVGSLENAAVACFRSLKTMLDDQSEQGLMRLYRFIDEE